jgi:hypothetical protein
MSINQPGVVDLAVFERTNEQKILACLERSEKLLEKLAAALPARNYAGKK